MIVYRAVAYDPAAAEGAPGGVKYVYPKQTTGRWDNFPHYTMAYVSRTPEGGIAEVFGRHPEWSDGMFNTKHIPSARYALGRYSMPDDIALVDFDDAATLVNRAMRPTQVVIQNTAYTQSVALKIFRELTASAERQWAGLAWWSRWKPIWPVAGIWFEPGQPFPLDFVDVEPLALTHPAIIETAKSLSRVIRP